VPRRSSAARSVERSKTRSSAPDIQILQVPRNVRAQQDFERSKTRSSAHGLCKSFRVLRDVRAARTERAQQESFESSKNRRYRGRIQFELIFFGGGRPVASSRQSLLKRKQGGRNNPKIKCRVTSGQPHHPLSKRLVAGPIWPRVGTSDQLATGR